MSVPRARRSERKTSPRPSRSLRHKMAPATPTPVNTASPRSRCVIAIEGNIGIGKSTLLNALKRRFENDVSVVLVDEPVALWEEHGLLEAMYTDTINRCAFQVMAVTTRYTSLLDAVLRSEAEVIITERSIFSDRACFAKVNLTAGSPDETAYGVTHDALVNSLPEDLRLGTVLLQGEDLIEQNELWRAARHRIGDGREQSALWVLAVRGGELVLEVPVRLAQVGRVLVRRRRAPADPTLQTGARVVHAELYSSIGNAGAPPMTRRRVTHKSHGAREGPPPLGHGLAQLPCCSTLAALLVEGRVAVQEGVPHATS